MDDQKLLLDFAFSEAASPYGGLRINLDFLSGLDREIDGAICTFSADCDECGEDADDCGCSKYEFTVDRTLIDHSPHFTIAWLRKNFPIPYEKELDYLRNEDDFEEYCASRAEEEDA